MDGINFNNSNTTTAAAGIACNTKSDSLSSRDFTSSKESALEASSVSATAATLETHQRRNIVFPDPVAFRYLEEDAEVKVVERLATVPGYELYLVEQWACSRLSPTLAIVTFTGDEHHCIKAGILSVPADRNAWSAKLRVYFKALEQNHARPKESEKGELMVTNLSSFPSALTVIPVPDGDLRKHRQHFIVNEDLKRLGCSGRAGMTLTDPSNATMSKFYQLFKVNDRIPFADAVIEMVKLCQVALLMFGKLRHEYIDGLLCDKTESAVNIWWAEVGSEYYNIEPTDGILGPTTVSALLGSLMGARNRLAWCSFPVSKDVFDIDATKRGIGAFQKAHKLEKTRRLDRQTLLKLHTITAKAAAGETWGVQKAVKSTVAEIGGKRGELVIGMVGGRDKGGIGDIETLDLERFISLVTGERAKWLWYGKPRRTGIATEAHDRGSPELPDSNSPRDDLPIPMRQTGKKAVTLSFDEVGETRAKEQLPDTTSSMANINSLEGPLLPDKKRTVFKSVAGKMSDARSGLGRIKDVVGGGLRGHGARPSRDEPFGPGYPSHGSATAAESSLSSPVTTKTFTWKQKPNEYLTAMRREEPDLFPSTPQTEVAEGQTKSFTPGASSVAESPVRPIPLDGRSSLLVPPSTEIRKEIISSPPSVASSVVDERHLRGPILDQEQGPNKILTYLHRRHSFFMPSHTYKSNLNEARWPRRMSFSSAEDAILGWEDIHPVLNLDGPDKSLDKVELRDLFAEISSVRAEVQPWVLAKLSGIEAVDAALAKSQDQLQELYNQLSEAYKRAKEESRELVVEQREIATEAIRDIEVLVARLEYEIDLLVSKVQEVEDGVEQFEREVEGVERKAEELKSQLESESWLHWFVRTLTGIGTGPNITRTGR